MKIKELIEILKDYEENLEVVLFAEGKIYPILQVQEWIETARNGVIHVVELGGGWLEIEWSN